METYKNALSELRNKTKEINIIDVGCARGAFLRHVKDFFEDVYSIGIDPLDHGAHRADYSLGDFTYYVQCAIDNVKEESTAKFFINSDDQASSLLEMDFENITSEVGERDSKYFIGGADNLSIRDTIEVNVTRLDKIIEKYIGNRAIHFLKIDAEGNDLNVVKSLGKFINYPLFIALECSSHSDDNIRIFKNGCHINDIIPFMEENGYRIYEKIDHSLDPDNRTQMHDLIFIKSKINE